MTRLFDSVDTITIRSIHHALAHYITITSELKDELLEIYRTGSLDKYLVEHRDIGFDIH